MLGDTIKLAGTTYEKRKIAFMRLCKRLIFEARRLGNSATKKRKKEEDEDEDEEIGSRKEERKNRSGARRK